MPGVGGEKSPQDLTFRTPLREAIPVTVRQATQSFEQGEQKET